MVPSQQKVPCRVVMMVMRMGHTVPITLRILVRRLGMVNHIPVHAVLGAQFEAAHVSGRVQEGVEHVRLDILRPPVVDGHGLAEREPDPSVHVPHVHETQVPLRQPVELLHSRVAIAGPEAFLPPPLLNLRQLGEVSDHFGGLGGRGREHPICPLPNYWVMTAGGRG